MSASTTEKRGDPAFVLAVRCLALHRDVLRRDRNVRQTEQALALWARGHNISLRAATRSAHSTAGNSAQTSAKPDARGVSATNFRRYFPQHAPPTRAPFVPSS